MTGTVLGLHQNEWHNNHLTYIREEQPTADLILNASEGEAMLIRDTSPNTLTITRLMEWDNDAHIHNQYLQGDPVAAGEGWAAMALARFSKMGKVVTIINEPPCNVEALRLQAQAEVAFMKALDRDGRGLKAGIGAFSGGNLQHPSIDGGAQVRAYEPAFRYAAQHGHKLLIHLYFVRPAMGGPTPSGMVHHPIDLALRWTQSIFPWMRANGIPIPDTYPTEFGEDLGFARDLYGFTGEAQGVGWKSPTPWGYGDSEEGARQYAADMIAVAKEICRNTPEIKGILIYCAGDNGTHKWRSFMVDGYLLRYLGTQALPKPAQSQQPTGTVMIDLPSNHYSTRAGQRVKYIILHSTATPVGGTLESTANYLKQNERGVSIHELVGANIVYKMVADSNAAHHAESETARLPGGEPNYLNNELTWGIEAFQIADTPVAPLVARTMLERTVEACRRLGLPSSRVRSHQEIDPTRRSDPVGVNMTQFRQAVATALGEGQAPPNADPFLLQVKQRQEIANNPGTAFMRAARSLGYYNTLGDEVYGTIGGRNTVGQLFANAMGNELVFWAYAGDWDNVQHALVPQQAVA